MAYSGITAKLAVGGSDVGYISNFSVEETTDIVEITKLGSQFKEKVPTLYGWSASADGAADFSDGGQTALRNAMIDGSEVVVKFYLQIPVDADPANNITKVDEVSLSGTALVESFSVDISAEDKANVSISLAGIGKLTCIPA